MVGGVQPALDAHGRGVDDEGVDAGVILHHAEHAEHAAPGVAEQVDVVQAEGLAHRVELVDPQVVRVEVVLLVGDLRLAAANLVVEDDLAAVAVGHLGVFKQVVMAVAGAAMEDEQRLLAGLALTDDLAVGLETGVVHVDFFDFRHMSLPSR